MQRTVPTLWLVLVCLAPSTVLAQSASFPNGNTQPILVESDGVTPVQRDPSLNLATDVFSYDDCAQDRQLRYTLSVDNTDPTLPLEAWLSTGEDCAEVDSLDGSCWRALPEAIPNAPVAEAVIRLQDIAAGSPRLGSQSERQGSDYVRGTAASCQFLPQVDVNLSFLFVRGAQVEGESARTSVTLDTMGPQPKWPTVEMGDASARVSWEPATDIVGMPGVSTRPVSKYVVYCMSANEANSDGCPTGALTTSGTPLNPPVSPPAAVCATTDADTHEVVITDLTNDRPYAFHVVAFDEINNPGVSVIQCGTPSESAEEAEEAEDLANTGGAGCNVAGSPLSAGASGAWVTLMLLWARRKRSAA